MTRFGEEPFQSRICPVLSSARPGQLRTAPNARRMRTHGRRQSEISDQFLNVGS